jgi:two-component system NarL family response regulator
VKVLSSKQRILLVDDHQIFRQSLRALLENYPHIEIIGEASNGEMAVRLSETLIPDIVFMDISMADVNGIEATRMIIEAHPKIKIIALSTYSDQVYVNDIMNAGAVAFVCKSEGIEELQHALDAVVQGKIYLCSSVAKVLARALFDNRFDTLKKSVSLSNREQQILSRIANCKSSAMIAVELGIAVGTVDVHRRNIMRKLDLHSAVELTRYALNVGLVSS